MKSARTDCAHKTLIPLRSFGIQMWLLLLSFFLSYRTLRNDSFFLLRFRHFQQQNYRFSYKKLSRFGVVKHIIEMFDFMKNLMIINCFLRHNLKAETVDLLVLFLLFFFDKIYI